MLASQSPPTWLKSGRCEANACVEVARVGDQVAVRNSNHPDGPTLNFTREEWNAFVGGVEDGEFRLDEVPGRPGYVVMASVTGEQGFLFNLRLRMPARHGRARRGSRMLRAWTGRLIRAAAWLAVFFMGSSFKL